MRYQSGDTVGWGDGAAAVTNRIAVNSVQAVPHYGGVLEIA